MPSLTSSCPRLRSIWITSPPYSGSFLSIASAQYSMTPLRSCVASPSIGNAISVTQGSLYCKADVWPWSSDGTTGWLEVLAIAGLMLVWPAGVVLLWLSRVWSTTAKLIGMLVPPGGYALLGLAAWMLLFHPDRLCCTSQYSENGKLISSNCPPLPPAAVLSVIVNLAILLWLVLPIVSTIVLATRAWRSIGRNLRASATSTVQGASRGIGLRLGLILATLTGPVVAPSIVAASVLTASANPQAPGTAGGDHAVPSVSPSPLSDLTPGIPALPNLTVSQFKRAFGDEGFSCQPPVELAGQWATACTRARAGEGDQHCAQFCAA